MRQVVDGPGGQRYVVAAAPVPGGQSKSAGELLSGVTFLPDGPWEVRVEGGRGHQVFSAPTEEVAERLVLLLGNELETGVFLP
jgi:hypothetical protein